MDYEDWVEAAEMLDRYFIEMPLLELFHAWWGIVLSGIVGMYM